MRYARSGDAHVAYDVLGTGPTDVLIVNESMLPIEALHENVFTASFLVRLGTWARVIIFDRRGIGLSDGVGRGLLLEHWVGDALAVLDAAGSERAAVFSFGPSAGTIALQLAADAPQRVSFLCVYDAIARFRWAPDYPWGVTADEESRIDEPLRNEDGAPRLHDRRGRFTATAAQHPGFADWAITWFRRGAAPATNAAVTDVLRSSDVRAALPSIACPTVVVNHAGVGDGRYLVEQIAGARYVELHDPCHLLFSPALDRVMAVVDEMLDRPMAIEPPSRRILTTVLFADVAARHVAVRQIALHGGVEATTPAPGVVATFDSPTTAVRYALAIAGDAARAQILARLGVHAGEIELLGGDVRGATVELAGRIATLAATGQVIVTRPVVDLVTDTTVRFEALGEHQPRGLGPRRALFAATTAPQPLRDMPPPPQARLAELSPASRRSWRSWPPARRTPRSPRPCS